ISESCEPCTPGIRCLAEPRWTCTEVPVSLLRRGILMVYCPGSSDSILPSGRLARSKSSRRKISVFQERAAMRNAFTGLWSVFFLCGVFGFARAADFTVGTATAKSGQKITGFLQVPAGVDPATDIPIALINGARPGPTLALIAGSHGTEYASIVALQKMIQIIDPADLSGVLIIVPLVNTASFLQKVPHL